MSTTASAANENGVMSPSPRTCIEASLTLVAGIGVADDVHAAATVKHRSRVALIRRSRTCVRFISSKVSYSTSFKVAASTCALARPTR